MPRFRIAIIESPNPIDLFDDRSEATALAASCRIMGHQATSFFVRSRREFQETILYISSADTRHAKIKKPTPLILHISTHGNSGSVTIGTECISWNELVNDIKPLINNPDYNGKLIVSLSSCGSGSNTITKSIKVGKKNKEIKQPTYIFSISGESVKWDDALIAWNLLYLKLSRLDLEEPKEIIKSIDEVLAGTGTNLFYSRWCNEKAAYVIYPPKEKRKNIE
ncbi:hypothetical protein [Janthinobacterium lividum]